MAAAALDAPPWLQGVRRQRIVNGVLKPCDASGDATAADGELVCYTFEVAQAAIYVVPTQLPSTQCAAFVAVASEYGGSDLQRFIDIARDVYNWTETEFADLLDAIDISAFIVETDKRKMLNIVAEQRLPQTVRVAPQPTLVFAPWVEELRHGADITVTISLTSVPPLFTSLVLDLSCATGGLVFNPAQVQLRAPTASTTVQVVAQEAGEHVMVCTPSGLNYVDVILPPARAITVVSHETAVLESCIDTFAVVLENCEARDDYRAFEYAVNRYFHPHVSQGTICDVLKRMMDRSLLRLMLKTIQFLSEEVMDDMCNMQFHHVPLCHWAIICEDMELTVRIFQCPSFDIVTASTAVAVALIINCEEFALELMSQCTYLRVDGYIKGATALCTAVENGMERVVMALLEKGADVNRTNGEGETPVYLCFKEKPFKIGSARALLQSDRVAWQGMPGKKNMEALGLAAADCQVDGVRYFLEAGCPIAREFFVSLSVVIHTQHERKHATAEVLIAEGRKARCLNVPGPSGQTLLQTACSQLDTKMVDLLLAAQVDPLVTDHQGQTCIHTILAGHTGDAEEAVVRLQLLEAVLAAIPLSMDQMCDRNGRSPLHYAAGYGTGHALPAAIDVLINSGFQLALDTAMRSPLHYAIACADAQSTTVMKLLRAVDGNIDGVSLIAPPHNDTILSIAIDKGMVDVVEIICEKFMLVGGERMFGVRNKVHLTPLLAALLYPCMGGIPQDANAEDRDRALRMARAVLSASKVNLDPMETHPYATPLLLASQRAYGLIVSDLVRRDPPAADAGPYCFAALLGVPPFHTPEVYKDIPKDERDVLLSTMFGQLLTYPYDEGVLVPYTERGDDDQGRSLFQIVCAKGNPKLLLQYCNGVSMQWDWEAGQDIAEHPLTLILRSDAPAADKEQAFSIVLPFLRDELKLNPTVLMVLVQRCIEHGLASLLKNLVGLHKMVVEALLPGGVTLLQLALTSPKITDTATRAAVCEVLIDADVKVNMQGVADHGTALQEAVRQNMWDTISLICKAPHVDVSLSTNSCAKTPMILLLEKVNKYPDEATKAITQLLETGTVVDVEYDDAVGMRVNIAAIVCAKGLASVVYPLFKHGLLNDPKQERKDRFRYTSLAHRAVSAPRLVKEGESAKHYGPGATLSALSGAGYLTGAMDIQDEKGFTPVCKAFYKGSVSAVRVLLGLGARYARGKEGQPPASILLNSHNVDDDIAHQCLTLLTDDAPLVQINLVRDGGAALHTACTRGFLKTAELLVAQKAEVNVLDVHHNTPLLCAIKSDKASTEKKAALIRLLLRCSNIQPAYGDSPLHWMFRNRRVEKPIVVALLDAPKAAQAKLLNLAAAPTTATGAPTEEGDTCVYILAAKHIVRVVLDAEADDGQREEAVGALEVLVGHIHDNPANMGPSAQALHILAVQPDNPYLVRASLALVSAGVDCGQVDAHGLTALQIALRGLRHAAKSAASTPTAASASSRSLPPPSGDASADTASTPALGRPSITGRAFPTIVEYLKALMDGRGFNPAVKDKRARTLLHFALKLGDDDLAVAATAQLLSHFALHYETCDINDTDMFGKSMLTMLTESALGIDGKTELLGHVMQVMDLNPELLGSTGTILHYAVQCLQPEAVAMCIQSLALSQHIDRAEFWATRDAHGCTVVHSCFARRDSAAVVDVLELLMQHAFVMDFSAADNQHRTPLMRAVAAQNWAAADIIARAHCQNNGWTVLSPDGACVLHHIMATVASPQEAVRWVQLIAPTLASEHGTLDAIRAGDGETVMHVAARRCFTSVCDVLMADYACNPYASSNHETALHCCLARPAASLTSTLCAMRILHKTPADLRQHWGVRSRVQAGRTPLMLAAKNGHVDVVRFLLAEGTDVMAQDTEGLTALHHAVLFSVPDDAPPPADRSEHARVAHVVAHAEANTHYEEVGLLLLRAMDLTQLTRGREVTEAAALRGSLKLLRVLVEEARTAPPAGIMETVLQHESQAAAAAVPSVAGYLAHYFREEEGESIPGLPHLRRCNEPYLCATLAAGQAPNAVADWLAHLGQRDPPQAIDNILANFKRYAAHCDLSGELNHTPKYPAGSNTRLGEEEEAVCLMLLEQCPNVFRVSRELLNRYVARLLVVHCRPPSEVPRADAPLVRREAFTEALMSVIPPAALLLLSTTSVATRDHILPPKGLIQPDATALFPTLRSLFEASVVFSQNAVMRGIVESFRDSPALCDLTMLETVALERGDVDAVHVVFDAKRKSSTRPSPLAVESFFRRRAHERQWIIFEVLLHNRVRLTEQGLLYILEQGRIAYRNALGDTVLHILAMHSQFDLLEGFYRQVPHHQLLVSPEVKNVFGKRAIDYCSEKSLQDFGRIFCELRDAGRQAVSRGDDAASPDRDDVGGATPPGKAVDDVPTLPPTTPRNIPQVRYTAYTGARGTPKRAPSPLGRPGTPYTTRGSPSPQMGTPTPTHGGRSPSLTGAPMRTPFKYINGLINTPRRPHTPHGGGGFRSPEPPHASPGGGHRRRGRPLAFEERDTTPPPPSPSELQLQQLLHGGGGVGPPQRPRSRKRTQGTGMVQNKGGTSCIAVGSGRIGAAVVRKVW